MKIIKRENLSFKEKVTFLVEARKKVDRLFIEGKISEKKKKEIKKIISYEWDVAYNQRLDIPQSVKQGFNLLYTNLL